jgi:hypothetical protein
MARMRTIKPEACTSESLAELPRAIRWTFACLWTHCDDEGRAVRNARLIKAAVYPLDDEMTPDAVAFDLAELERIGAVCFYEVDGREYLHIPSWSEHQHPNRPVPSKLPACPKTDHTSTPHTQRSESAVSPQPQRTPVVGVVVGDGDGTLGAKPRRETLAKPPPKARAPDPIWDAVTAACSIDTTQLTSTARGATNKAVAELRAVDASPDQIRARAAAYRRTYPNAALTPSALVKHWGQLNGTRRAESEPPYYDKWPS